MSATAAAKATSSSSASRMNARRRRREDLVDELGRLGVERLHRGGSSALRELGQGGLVRQAPPEEPAAVGLREGEGDGRGRGLGLVLPPRRGQLVASHQGLSD